MAQLAQLCWVFMKIGLLCWGGGIVMIPLVQTEVVLKYGWLTQQEFVDAVTLGQVSPGPVVISATFIGYRVAGLAGAVAATVGVILPSFLLVCLSAKAVERLKENRLLMGFFHGARAAVIGLIFEAALSIGRVSIFDVRTALIGAASLGFLVRYKLNPVWILMGAIAVAIVS